VVEVKEQKQNNMKNGPYKMKGYSYPGTSPLSKNVDPPNDKEKMVKYTSPNKPDDYGTANTSSYEILISKATQNLIDAGAPKDVIKKSKDKDLESFRSKSKA